MPSKKITFEIPAGTPASKCGGCNATIYWIRTKKGKSMPVDPGGESHFASCPQANRYRKPR